MAEENQPEKPQFDYPTLLKTYYELGLPKQIGVGAHLVFLGLLHKANSLRFKRFFRITSSELSDLSGLTERGIQNGRNKLLQLEIQGIPLVLYTPGHRGVSPTYAIMYELLNGSSQNFNEIKRKKELFLDMLAEIKEIISSIPHLEEINASKSENVDNLQDTREEANDNNGSQDSKKLSTKKQDRGNNFLYPPLRGTTCLIHNLGSCIQPPPLLTDISSIANNVPEVGAEGEGILSKREKTEEEIQDIVAKLAQHSIKSKKVATQLAKKYTTSFIYRHIMQIKHDHRKGQRWKDPGGILVARIRRGKETSDFKAKDYPEEVYIRKFRGEV